MIDIKRVTVSTDVDIDGANRLLAQQSPGKKQRSITAEELSFVLENPLFYLFVAVDPDSGGYLGMATMFFQRNLARWISEIHDVVVDRSHRRKGIGRLLTEKLLDTALEFSKSHQAKIKLYLTSRPSRVAANSLYQKLGFVLVSQSYGEWGTNLYKIIAEPTGLRSLS